MMIMTDTYDDNDAGYNDDDNDAVYDDDDNDWYLWWW